MKQKLIKFVEKKLNEFNREKTKKLKEQKKDKTFTFWWYLAKNLQDMNIRREICSSMGFFYFGKNSSVYTNITDVLVLGNTIYIYTKRPGLIIGKAGKDIDDLTKSINYSKDGKKLYDYHINLIEDNCSGSMELINNIYIRANNF